MVNPIHILYIGISVYNISSKLSQVGSPIFIVLDIGHYSTAEADFVQNLIFADTFSADSILKGEGLICKVGGLDSSASLIIIIVVGVGSVVPHDV